MVLLAGVAAFIYAGTAGAATLKISPLSYRVDLASGEKKKGYVDITNPGPVTEKVQLTVQAFRQIDDNGTLEFYDNAALSAGLLLDYQQVEIGPHEVLHLAFIADGTKLPGGDVFGAILAATLPGEESAANQAAQVGALVIISNGQTPQHTAKVEHLSVPIVQAGENVSVRFVLRNTTPLGAASGFSPPVTITMWPYISDTVEGPLVFAGRSRQVDYLKKGNYFGILRVQATTGDSSQVAYSLAITGYWRWMIPAIIAGIGISLYSLLQLKNSDRPAKRKARPPKD